MCSWGGNNERRADRMPSMRVQAMAHRQPGPYTIDDLVKRAMMDDLGTIRIEELPLDDTHNPGAIPSRPRHAPVIAESSEALNGYRAMAENGIDDAEAMTVKDLDDLGGPSAYRPTVGTARRLMADPRRPPSTFNGMQTSPNGILLPPGSVVHRFPSNKGVSENAPAASNIEGKAAGSRSGNVEAASTFKSLPPHLRAKKNAKTPQSDKSSPEKAASGKISNLSTKITSAVVQTKGNSVTPTILAAHKYLSQRQGVVDEPKKSRPSEDLISPVKHGQGSEQDDSNNEVVIYWTGSCKTWVPEKGKDCVILIDLKIINNAQDINGQSLLIMTLPEVFVKRYSMRAYLLDIQKSHICVVRFVNPDTGVLDDRYSLKFDDVKTATEFQHRAALLQKVMGFLSNVAAANSEMNVEAASAAENTAARNQTHQSDLSVTVSSVKNSTGTLEARERKEPESVAEDTKPSAKIEATKNTPKTPRDIADVMTDAFNNLSLNKVKNADMYKTNRQRVQYSAQELLKQRSSAAAPLGLSDIKIPQDIPLVPRRDSQPTNSSSIHDSAKLKNWISAGKKPQLQTKGGSQTSMPGLSEAVEYQKAVAITAESSAQVNMESSSDIKAEKIMENTVVTKVGDKLKENAESNAKVDTKADKRVVTEANVGITAASKAENANVNIETEIATVKTTPAEEVAISVQPNQSDDGAAVSTALNDFAVGFQFSPNDERPSTAVIELKDKKPKDITVQAIKVEALVTAAATVANKQDVSAKETSPMVVTETSAQPDPTMAPTTATTVPSAVHSNPLYGLHGHGGQEIPLPIPMSHTASPQMFSPPMATQHMATPQFAYTPQMYTQPMIPGLQQYPPAGIVHAVSVTYHISHSGSVDGTKMNAGQEPMPHTHPIIDFSGNQTGRTFSPGTQAIQPQSRGQVPQRHSGLGRMRRGLESSIFATGYSGAKHAGSFTGGASE